MPVRSRPFVGLTSIVGGAMRTIYTVPAGRTAVVRHYTILNLSGAPRTVRLGVRTGGVNIDVYRHEALPAAAALGGDGLDLVLGPGDSLLAYCDTGVSQPMHIFASGSLLLGEPT